MYIVYNLLFTITINIEIYNYNKLLGYTNLHKCNIFPLENLWYTSTLLNVILSLTVAVYS